MALRGRVHGFGEWSGVGEVEAGYAGGAEEGDGTDVGVEARRVGSGEGGGAG